jgi:ABC-type nitrate/sulfonate/bicarbonate transport system substrate-binding protein
MSDSRFIPILGGPSMAIKALLRLAAVAIVVTLSTLQADAQTKVGVSYQPALYWSLPFYVATEKGLWKDVDIDPQFSTFPAGAPQIAAAPSRSWDVGGTGSPPAVLGASRFNILTIGIANDESAVTLLVARSSDAAQIEKTPALLKGKEILLSTNSTGEYAAISCLKKLGLSLSDMKVVNLGPAQEIAAFSNGNGAVAAAWAPYGYRLQEKAGAKPICNGKQAGVVVGASLVSRADYAKEHPSEVAKVLAVYLRSVVWQKKNKAETMRYMKAFYAQGGVNLSDQFIEEDYDSRPIYDLAEQLELFDRHGGPSKADQLHTALAEYLQSTGTIAAIPNPNNYITDQFLKRIDADPKLHAFANGQ